MEPVSDPQGAYRAYGPALVRKAERILRSREDAVDVVHALFADLLPRWSSDVNLPYLYRAVTNRCLNILRDHATKTRLLEREQVAATPVARVRLDDQVVGVALIAALADRLDPGHLEVLVCRFVDDMTQEEIAEHLGLSRKTIGKRLDRIRDAASALREEAAS
ncbi:MAG: sigma-70 family RNA polymerase sigma factor [Deltaproteobacteria bacterium]|nr:sigma-70 family RNA polymerase sigma factor [Deltaproteobacteria bacterium]MCW5806492.1 sigma-70 family RNA polymerase sigma factor [Deltaproteobacteria bacterium]